MLVITVGGDSTVNSGWFVAALPLTVTTTGPDLASAGTTTFNCVDEALATKASFPLNETLFSLNTGLNAFPVIATIAFGNADCGLIAVTSAIAGSFSSSSQANKTPAKSTTLRI